MLAFLLFNFACFNLIISRLFQVILRNSHSLQMIRKWSFLQQMGYTGSSRGDFLLGINDIKDIISEKTCHLKLVVKQNSTLTTVAEYTDFSKTSALMKYFDRVGPQFGKNDSGKLK